MKISRRASVGRATYEESKHARGPGGKFAEKAAPTVNKSSSAPQNAVPAGEAKRHARMTEKNEAKARKEAYVAHHLDKSPSNSDEMFWSKSERRKNLKKEANEIYNRKGSAGWHPSQRLHRSH